MAVRESMLPLITRLRVLVGDPASETEIFDDEELQAFLDERRGSVDTAILRGDSVATGSPTVFRAPVGGWESDLALVDAAGSALTPLTAGTDHVVGVWAFATGQANAVYVTGRYYDLYGTAASVLQARAVQVVEQFDFGAETGVYFKRSQKLTGLMAIAREYGRKAISPSMRSAW